MTVSAAAKGRLPPWLSIKSRAHLFKAGKTGTGLLAAHGQFYMAVNTSCMLTMGHLEAAPPGNVSTGLRCSGRMLDYHRDLVCVDRVLYERHDHGGD